MGKAHRGRCATQVAADAGIRIPRRTTHTARLAHDEALANVLQHLLKEDTQVNKQVVETESFRRHVGDSVYSITRPSFRQSPGL